LGRRRRAAFLIVYNVGHVALRWWALQAGWAHGAQVGVALHHPVLQKAGTLLGPAMACAVGAALPLTATYLVAPFPAWARLSVVVTAALGYVALRWRAGRLTGLQLALALAAGALAAGWLWP